MFTSEINYIPLEVVFRKTVHWCLVNCWNITKSKFTFCKKIITAHDFAGKNNVRVLVFYTSACRVLQCNVRFLQTLFPYGQIVIQRQDISVNYQGADQRPGSSLRTTNGLLQWRTGLVVLLFRDLPLIYWGERQHFPGRHWWHETRYITSAQKDQNSRNIDSTLTQKKAVKGKPL